MKHFLEVADKRLIVPEGQGGVIEWMEDWLRAFKGNPAEFVDRPPLESLPPQQRGFLKQVLAEPDPGDFWKLDDPIWTNGAEPPFPHNYWTRGIIAEIDLYHRVYKPAGYAHLSVEKAIDYTRLATPASPVMAVQVKTVKNPATAMARMEKAIDALITQVPSGKLRLHVLVKPGEMPAPLEAALNHYRDNLPDFVLPDKTRLEIMVDNFSAVP